MEEGGAGRGDSEDTRGGGLGDVSAGTITGGGMLADVSFVEL